MMNLRPKKVFILFVVLHVIQLYAQDLPQTPAGKRAEEVVELLNGTSSYDLEDYITNQYAPSFRDAFPISAHKGIFQSTHTMFGQLKLADISKSSPAEISIVLKSEKKEAWLNLSLQVEPDEPHRIVSMGLRPGSRPANDKIDKQEEDDTQKEQNEIEDKPQKEEEAQFSNLEELHQYLLSRTEENEFSGVILIAKDGNSILHKAYGYASKRFQVPNQLDTKFNLGSGNKILQLLLLLN